MDGFFTYYFFGLQWRMVFHSPLIPCWNGQWVFTRHSHRMWITSGFSLVIRFGCKKWFGDTRTSHGFTCKQRVLCHLPYILDENNTVKHREIWFFPASKCVSARMYAHAWAFWCGSACVHGRAWVYVRVCVSACACACVSAFVGARVRVCVGVHVCVCVRGSVYVLDQVCVHGRVCLFELLCS